MCASSTARCYAAWSAECLSTVYSSENSAYMTPSTYCSCCRL
jgi:hypothetical protein